MKGGKMMNRKYTILLTIILSVGIVAGAWLFSVTGGFSFIVNSLPGYATLNINIPTLEVNTTSQADNDTKTTTFLINKNMIMNVSISELFQDNSGGECLGGINDCEIHYYLENEEFSAIEIFDKQNVSLIAMALPRQLNATMVCQAYSCPQARTVEIILTEALS